jgi:hypothetical protein
MTDTNGLDILIAWSLFLALLMLLGVFVLGARTDPVEEAKRGTDGSPAEDKRG